MKQRPFSYIYVCVILLLQASCSQVDRKVFRVWVLHSYQEECSWMEDMNRGIRDGFNDANVRVELTFSYLHSNYDKKRCYDSVQARLNRIERPDVILSVNDQATEALANSNHPYTKRINGCHVVFCGIDYPGAFRFDTLTSFSGYTTPVNMEKSSQLLNLYRLEKGQIFFKHNNLCDKAVDQIVKPNNVANYSFPLELDSLDQKSYHDTYYSMVLFKNQYFNLLPEWDCYLPEFVQSSGVPFLALSNEGFGDGYLGGYFTPSYDLAYDGAKRAVLFLTNREAEGLAVQESESFLNVDWEVMNRFDFPLWKLPPNTRIINMPFWVKYETLLTGLVVFSVMCLIILVIFFIYKIICYKQREKLLERKVKEEYDGLQVISDSINEGIISIDNKGNILSINAEARTLLLLDCDESEYIGHPLHELIEIVDQTSSHGLQSLLDMVLKNKKTIEVPPFTTLQCSKSGKFFLVEGEFTPLLYHTTFDGAVFCFTDRTDEFTTQEFLTLTARVGQLFFWWYDFNTGRLTVDPAFFDIFELPDDGTHTLPLVDFLQALNPEDLEQWKTQYDRLRFGQDIKSVLEARLSFNGRKEEW